MIKKNHFEQILFWLIAGLIVFIPLYPKFPLFNVPGTYVAIRLEDFLLSFVISLWLIFVIIYKREIFKNIYFRIFLLFWFIGLVSIISALLITNSITPHLGFLHWLRRIEFIILFWVAGISIINKQQIKYLTWIFIYASCLVIFYGFGQLYLGFKVVSTIDKDFSTGIISTLSPAGRVNSTFGGHYDLAIYLSYTLIILTGIFFYVKELWKKAGIIILGILCILLQGYAASRISFIATIAAMILVLFLLRKKALILGLVIISFIIVMIIPQFRDRIVATLNVNMLNKIEKSYTPSKLEQEINTEEQVVKDKAKLGLPIDIAAGESTDYTELEVGRSISIRLTDEWPRALNAFYKNPLLGTGYSSISLATDNDYLRALGETGIMGIISLFILFFVLIRNFIYHLKTSDRFNKILFIIILAIIADALITAIFIDIFEASKVAILFWLLLGIAWSQTRNKNNDVRHKM